MRRASVCVYGCVLVCVCQFVCVLIITGSAVNFKTRRACYYDTVNFDCDLLNVRLLPKSKVNIQVG
jgi:hypothetical protein